MTNKFYDILPGTRGLLEAPSLAIAEETQQSAELREKLIGGGWVENWEPLEHQISGGFSDYLTQADGFRLCSEKLREVLENVKREEDALQWLEAPVVRGPDERQYWILHFPVRPDVLAASSVLHDNPEAGLTIVVRAVIDSNKAASHAVMPSPGRHVMTFTVSESAKRAIESAGCVGITFRESRVE